MKVQLVMKCLLFQVLYVGKIKVWNKKVPNSFIDDAIEKFKVHELAKRCRVLGGSDAIQEDEAALRRGSMVSIFEGILLLKNNHQG